MRASERASAGERERMATECVRLRSVIVPGRFAFRAFFVKRPKAAPRYRFRVSPYESGAAVRRRSLVARLPCYGIACTYFVATVSFSSRRRQRTLQFSPNHEGNSLRFISHCTGCAFCTGRNYRQLGKDSTHAIKSPSLSLASLTLWYLLSPGRPSRQRDPRCFFSCLLTLRILGDALLALSPIVLLLRARRALYRTVGIHACRAKR